MAKQKIGGLFVLITEDDYKMLSMRACQDVNRKLVYQCHICGVTGEPDQPYKHALGLCEQCAKESARLYHKAHSGDIPWDLMTQAEREAYERERASRPKPFKISKKHRNELHERDGWKCHYCGNSNPGELTLDHKTPRSRGGDDSDENLITACKSCNSRKRNKTYDEYLEWLAQRKENVEG